MTIEEQIEFMLEGQRHAFKMEMPDIKVINAILATLRKVKDSDDIQLLHECYEYLRYERDVRLVGDPELIKLLNKIEGKTLTT